MFSLKGSSQGELKIKTHQDHVAQVAWVGNKELSVDNYRYNKIDKTPVFYYAGYQYYPGYQSVKSRSFDLPFLLGMPENKCS